MANPAATSTARPRPQVDNRRRYPRATADEPGWLVRRDPSATHDAPIRVVCVSPGGVRIEIDDALGEQCVPGASVVVRFGASQRPFELPGKVVWAQRGAGTGSAGIALRLELAPSLVRHGYARWVVGRLSGTRS